MVSQGVFLIYQTHSLDEGVVCGQDDVVGAADAELRRVSLTRLQSTIGPSRSPSLFVHNAPICDE